MADNLTLQTTPATPPTGSVIATDDVGGVHYQRVKLVDGTLDSGTAIPGDATNGLDVDVTRVQGSVTVIQGTGTNLHTVVDSGTITTVSTVTTITNVVHVDDNAGSLTVDGTVTATLSGTTNAGATAKTSDYDSGAGTDTVTMFGIALPASGGAVQGGTSTNPLRTDPTGTTTQPVSGTVTANAGTGTLAVSVAAGATTIAKAEDVASANADVGVPAMAVQKATPANTAGTDGDYEMLQISAGRLWASATIDAALPTGTNSIGDIRSITTSIIPGTGATNLGKAIDTALGATDTGVLALAARKDTLAALTPVDGDVVNLRTDNQGSLWVHISGGAGSGGTSSTDGAAYTAGSSAGTPMMAAADMTTPTAATEDTLDIVRMTLQRAMHVNLRDASGAEVSVGGGTQYDEDAASAGAEKLTLAGAVRRDVAASSSGTDGDYSTINTDNSGRLWTRIGQLDNQNGSGNLTAAAQTVTISTLLHEGTVGIQVTGTFVATLQFEANVDGSNWFSIQAVAVGTSTVATATTTTGNFQANVAGFAGFRVRCSAYTSGTATVTIRTSIAPRALMIETALPTGSNVIGAVTQSGSWTLASLTPGTAAGNLGKAEDGASADGDTGVGMLAVRKATPANTSGTDGDYEFLQMSAGRLWVDPSGVTLTVASHAVTNAGTFAVQATVAAAATNIAKAEDVASADADVGVPAMAVRKATPANTSGTDGDYEMLQMSAGRLWASTKIDTALTQKPVYAASAAITCTLASLASSSTRTAGQESATVDNTSNLYDDALVAGVITTGTTPTAGTEIDVWVVAERLDGTWPDVFDGTESAETVTSENVRNAALKLGAVMIIDSTSNRAYDFAPFSVAALYGGVLPRKWSLFVTHNTAVALNATGGNHSLNYWGIQYQLV